MCNKSPYKKTAEGAKHWNHNVLLHSDTRCYCEISRKWLQRFFNLQTSFIVSPCGQSGDSDNTSQMQAIVQQRNVHCKRCTKTVHFRTTT